MMGASRSRSRLTGTAGAEAEGVSLSEPLLDCAAAAALLNVRVSWVRDATRLGAVAVSACRASPAVHAADARRVADRAGRRRPGGRPLPRRICEARGEGR